MKKTESAGGVVLNARGEVAVADQGSVYYSLPKGHIDPGETPREAAEREIREETGITKLEFVRELGVYERYKGVPNSDADDTSEMKRIHLFLYRTTQEELVPEDPAHPRALWVPKEKVADMLNHPKDRDFFTSVLPLLD